MYQIKTLKDQNQYNTFKINNHLMLIPQQTMKNSKPYLLIIKIIFLDKTINKFRQLEQLFLHIQIINYYVRN